jgi:hypothetical protein
MTDTATPMVLRSPLPAPACGFFLGDDLRADLAVATPLGYRAPDNTTRSARVLFSLSNSFRLCPERAQVRCL